MLKLTGMSYDVARFQARSAFTGTGFTTTESEMIINHPVRRKIIGSLMVTGNIGFISFVSSLVISFLGASPEESSSKWYLVLRISIMLGGVFILFLVARSHWVDRLIQFFIERALKRWTHLNVQDYESLLNLSGEYSVFQYQIHENSWLADRTLETLQIINEGVLVLGVKRFDGYYVGAPQRDTMLYKEDEVVFYGKERVIRDLTKRKKGSDGDAEHAEAVRLQRMVTNQDLSLHSSPDDHINIQKKRKDKTDRGAK